MKALLALLPGDGIGPEVVAEGARLLRAVAERFGHAFELTSAPIGGCAIDETGSPLPPATLDLCRRADAVLLGAVGGPRWDPPAPLRPEQGLLELRRALGLYANLRPVKPHPALLSASPLRPEILRGTDLVVVRELCGGLYFGEKRRQKDRAFDACTYTETEITRVVRLACRLATRRLRRVVSIDKANVLETSRLWREVTERVVRAEFPALELRHLYVDAAAMLLVRRPTDFDVIVTENLFGDILSDEAAVLCGSIGMLPSASLGEGRQGLYEPIHGSAPDIAGRGLANPYGTLLSVALLLRHSLDLEREARAVEAAVARAIDAGVLPADLAPAGAPAASTEAVGSAVLSHLEAGA